MQNYKLVWDPSAIGTLTNRIRIPTEDIITATLDAQEINGSIFKFLVEELSWCGLGGSWGINQLRRESQNYEIMREYFKFSTVDLGRFQTNDPLIRYSFIEDFYMALSKNRALLEIAKQCEEIIRKKERQGHQVPTMSPLKIFLPFPEIRCNVTTHSVPITLLCNAICTHYNLYNDKDLSRIDDALSREVLESVTKPTESSASYGERVTAPFPQLSPVKQTSPGPDITIYIEQTPGNPQDDFNTIPSPVSQSSSEIVMYAGSVPVCPQYCQSLDYDPMVEDMQYEVESTRPFVPSQSQKRKRETSDPDYMPNSKCPKTSCTSYWSDTYKPSCSRASKTLAQEKCRQMLGMLDG